MKIDLSIVFTYLTDSKIGFNKKQADRFCSRIEEQSSGCIHWTGTISRLGYGQIGVNNKTFLSHRLVANAILGPIPKDKPFVCHTCDNPKCLNPDHLFYGSPKDNSQDMSKKKRFKPQIGVSNNSSKLTEEQVKEIKILLQIGEMTQKEIGEIYNVADNTVCGINTGKYWKHVVT